MNPTPLTRLVLAWVVLALTVGSAGATPQPVPLRIPVAIAAEARTEASKTRLTITLSQEVEAQGFLMERPDRVVIELPEINFQLPPQAGIRRDGLIASFRYGLYAPDRSRIVIDLTQPALISRLDVTTRPSDGAALMTIELVRTDRESFRQAVRPPDPPSTGSISSSAAPGPADPRPLIVLDAGHGGIDPGALASTGVFEKDIVIAFAHRLRERLLADGNYRVLLTREGDVFVSLDERVRMARAARADLFISIHADSISSAPHVRGGTVYTGAERATDAESANLADRENQADAVAGHDSRGGSNEVADILHELMLRETRGFSHRFAKKLLGQLGPVMPLSKKPHREAGFRVLRAPDVPSVLVELGYLSSRKDIDLLTSDAWRDRTAAAMTAAINQFFGARVAGQRLAPVSP